MSKAESYLSYLKSGMSVLENFLISGEIFWPIILEKGVSEDTGFSRISMGSMLFTRTMLDPADLSSAQRADLSAMNERLDVLKKQWLSHWQQKAQREVPTRLNLWQNFLTDVTQEKREDASAYKQEVRNRVILQLLVQEASVLLPLEQTRLENLDKQLHALFIEGPFIWDAKLEQRFPRQPFWFMYGKLSQAYR